jgi:hypothetical protein
VAGHHARHGALPGRRGRSAGTAGGDRGVAARRGPGRGAGRSARLRPGAPGPEAVQRAAGGRRTPGDRFRYLTGPGRHRDDRNRGAGRHAWVHVARAGQWRAGRPAERRVLLRRRGGVRGDGHRAVRGRQPGGHDLPGRTRGAHLVRAARRAGRPGAPLPGQAPRRARDRVGADGDHHGQPGPGDLRDVVLATGAGRLHRGLPGSVHRGHPGVVRARAGSGPTAGPAAAGPAAAGPAGAAGRARAGQPGRAGDHHLGAAGVRHPAAG